MNPKTSSIPETTQLIEQAHDIYLRHFSPETSFERAIFFSWGCTIGDCAFCYMTTQPADKPPKETKRSTASILAEFILAKNLGWDIGFFTGGIGVLSPKELEEMLRNIHEILGEKIWLSVGPVGKPWLLRYLPYIKGVVGSTETINPELHRKVCPSKPLKPYEIMFEEATKLGLQKAMTFIVGMGEQKEDLKLLKAFIQKYGIGKIHIYGLIPQKGTIFEHTPMPTTEEQVWWIANVRIAFPTLDIQCGIWEDRIERTATLLRAGANSISKFRATALFGTPAAQQLEDQVFHAERIWKGTLTKLPEIDWQKEISKLSFPDSLKNAMQEKLDLYLRKMKKNQQELVSVPQII